MKIGITGASGHVGANLCRALLQKGYQLRISIHTNSKSIETLVVEKIPIDITKYNQVENFVSGCDIIIHLAAKISIDCDPKNIVSAINLQGTKNVIKACEKFRVKKLIHFSSIHAFNPYPLMETLDESRAYISEKATPYDLSKVMAEKEILQARERGLHAVIIAPTSIFGPHDYYPSLLGKAMLDMYHRRIPALTPGGYDFVFVEDLVKGVIAVIENDCNAEKYIFSGNYITIKNVAKTIAQVCNKKLFYRIIPFELIQIALPVIQMQSYLTNKPALFTKESMNTLRKSPQKISSALAQKELGYTITSYPEAIAKTFDWYAAEGMLTDKKSNR